MRSCQILSPACRRSMLHCKTSPRPRIILLSIPFIPPAIKTNSPFIAFSNRRVDFRENALPFHSRSAWRSRRRRRHRSCRRMGLLADCYTLPSEYWGRFWITHGVFPLGPLASSYCVASPVRPGDKNSARDAPRGLDPVIPGSSARPPREHARALHSSQLARRLDARIQIESFDPFGSKIPRSKLRGIFNLGKNTKSLYRYSRSFGMGLGWKIFPDRR